MSGTKPIDSDQDGGDRLLISLLVNVKKSGLFALGADATVYVCGRPVLDRDQQILRFTDISLDVE